MLTFQIHKTIPLDVECADLFKSVAFDGYFFYLVTQSFGEIYKYDTYFKNCNCIKVSRHYTNLCYDKHLSCFWATAKNKGNTIYKLDLNLKEIDRILIASDPISSVITGISCEGEKNQLLLTFEDEIAFIYKNNCNTPHTIQEKSASAHLSGITAIDNYHVIPHMKHNQPSISIYSDCNQLELQCSLPNEYKIEDITLGFDASSHGEIPYIYILVTKACTYSYLLKCALTCDSDCEFDCFDRCFCCSDSDCCGHHICSRSCNDIIESIAYIETAIAHILNAEGEKIQAILKSSNKTCDILKVNESVNKTIINITHLEHILFSKLQLVKELCDDQTHCNCQSNCSCWDTCGDE